MRYLIVGLSGAAAAVAVTMMGFAIAKKKDLDKKHKAYFPAIALFAAVAAVAGVTFGTVVFVKGKRDRVYPLSTPTNAYEMTGPAMVSRSHSSERTLSD